MPDQLPEKRKWFQAERFAVYDLKCNGYTYNRLAEMFSCSVHAIEQIVKREKLFIVIFGEENYIKSHEMVNVLQLDGATYRALMAAKIYSVEDVITYLRDGNLRGKSNLRNLGWARLGVIADRLKELNLWTFEEKPKIPFPQNLPNHEDWEKCLEYWGNKCAVCRVDSDMGQALHQDHWVPRSLVDICPGTIVTNIIPLCWTCNTSKVNFDGYFWLIEREGKTFADQKMREILDYFDWWRAQGRE